MPKKANPDAEVYEVEYQAAVKNCRYFIENFVYIENRDEDSVEIPFTLWDCQKIALQAFRKERLIVFLKTRQVGASWLVIADTVWMCLRPGRSVLFLSKDDDAAKEMIRRIVFVMRHLPEWMVCHVNEKEKTSAILYDNIATQVTIYHPNAEPSIIKSFPSGEHAAASFTGNRLVLDEWALQQNAEKMWESAFPTVNRPTGGQVIGISTIEFNTLFEKIVRDALAGRNKFKLIFWPWNVDPNRNREWYEETVKTFGVEKTRRQYPASIDEALSRSEGAFLMS
jgi:hypothetical protein